MPKVSIIIPVYNVEKYLKRCLDSVINQTLRDIEIICVNDCSTDNSLEILKKYASQDGRIKLINLSVNQGVANARNIGIENANGEYIGFIDSDDFVDLDFYEKLYNRAVKSFADIVKGADIKIIHIDGSIEIEKQNDLIKKDKINFWHGFTTAIYRNEFIKNNKIDFPLLSLGEDPVFTIKSAKLSNTIEIINDAQYYYVRRENSLNSYVWDEQKLKNYCKHIEIMYDFINSQKHNITNFKYFINKILQNVIEAYNNHIIEVNNSEKIISDLIKKILSKSFQYPVKLLFDAMVFSAITDINLKRGIYYVAYNLIKKFFNDNRFEVSLLLERNYSVQPIKEDPILKNLKIIYSNIIVKNGSKIKLLKNPLFNQYDYDAYINVDQRIQMFNDIRPFPFNVLHDTIPMIKEEYVSKEHKRDFENFYGLLSKNVTCFCVSQDCKNGFIKYFPNLNKDKMLVTHIASANNFYPMYDRQKLQDILKKYNIKNNNNKYIFYLGAIYDVRKNLLFTIECFLKFIKKYNINDLYFYLGGSGEEYLEKHLSKKLGKLYEELKKHIVFLGYVEDADVNILYSNSLFFTFLSLYEGFGMPPLEAMQAGTPVVCSNNSSIPEVVGNAALLVNPQNEEEIVNAFSTLYFNEDVRKEFISKGLERTKSFSWDKTYKLISDRIIDVVTGKV